MITMAPSGSMRTSAIERSALLAPRTARATSACVNLAGLRTRATTVRFLALMVGLQKNHPHRCPTAPLVERHAGCCCYLGGPSRPIAQILAAVSQERGGHALWCSRGCLRAGALRLACRCSCPFSNAEILRMGNLLSHLLAEHALCAARPCLAVAAQKLHGGAQVSLQGAS